MKIAYVDAFSGISGDMFLGALIDAGLSLDELRGQLARLTLPDRYELEVTQTKKGALRASQFQVRVEQAAHTHHRHYSEIAEMIEASPLSTRVRQASLAIFRLLAEAEGRVHGTPPEEVHFHEVGAVDSIVDIVGAAVGLEQLEIERLYASPLPMGSGMVQSQHGPLPLPAPATLQVLVAVHAPTVPSPASVELVTPTGAALLGALATFEQPSLRLLGVGVGAGQRDLPWPNVLRLMLGEVESPGGPPLVLIETNIDDMNPQVFGHVMGRLLEAGALDVYLTPIYMKKNRPATLLGIIARKADEHHLARLVLAETTTLGLRVQPIYRYEAQRTERLVATPYGDVPLKLKLLDGQVVQAAPEYDVCARLADEHQVPLMVIYQAALNAA